MVLIARTHPAAPVADGCRSSGEQASWRDIPIWCLSVPCVNGSST